MTAPHSDQIIIGLMSGTSADGIDATAVCFSSDSPRSRVKHRTLGTHFLPFPKVVRDQINRLSRSSNNSDTTLYFNTREHKTLGDDLAQLYANASLALIEQNNIDTSAIKAIANHGQTIHHCPNASPPYSIQLGNSQLLANLTGIATISQFRQADLAQGGQGAPLMPAFHQALLSDKDSTMERFILNIGGIANLTQLGDQVIGFDTGPGNTLMDQWVLRHLNRNYDQDGAWAATGKTIDSLLDTLLNTAYFHLAYPKSTGTDYFNLNWLRSVEPKLEQYAVADIQATLLTLTVKSISLSLEQLGADSGEIFVCGGGAHNTHLMRILAMHLPDFSIHKTDHLGVPADWVEAIGFAWLGYCYLNGIPSNLPSVTGAKKAVVLGELFEPNNDNKQY